VPKFYYTFDYDEVIEFEGYLDTLYGSVSPEEKGSHRLPYNCSRLGHDVWKSYGEALNALRADCIKQVQKAVLRYQNVSKRYPDTFPPINELMDIPHI
jgi:hypothetical protein